MGSCNDRVHQHRGQGLGELEGDNGWCGRQLGRVAANHLVIEVAAGHGDHALLAIMRMWRITVGRCVRGQNNLCSEKDKENGKAQRQSH